MKNSLGTSVILTLFGESHGSEIGAVLDGLAPGIPVDEGFIAAQLAHRRARRIHGRYTLALEDLLQGRRFEDGIASCDFCLDVHAVSRAMNAKNPAGAPPGCSVKPYQIPLRACHAADADNLYMAGRCISGEFLPQASYRITGAAVGMGAGVAGKIAELCNKERRA